MREPRGSSRRRSLLVLALLAILGPAGCSYGFEGGGFPSHIQTIYIAPFENRTAQFDIEQRLYAALREQIPRQLGVRMVGEENADAILRGNITRYDDVAQNYRAGDPNQPNIFSHEVQIGISAELIDVRDNVILWESRGLTGRGTYRPDTQSDAVGQELAIDNIIEQIIDGAQSQW